MASYDKMLRHQPPTPHVPQEQPARTIQVPSAQYLRCNEPGCQHKGQLPAERCYKLGHALLVNAAH